MSQSTLDQSPDQVPPTTEQPLQDESPAPAPPFILYQQGDKYRTEVQVLIMWVHELLLPVYGRETTSSSPWCPRWWEHIEAVATLHGLWLAWQDLTSSEASLSGPAIWHRDYLHPTLNTLRDPAGPFAGCKPGNHRVKEPPQVDGPSQP